MLRTIAAIVAISAALAGCNIPGTQPLFPEVNVHDAAEVAAKTTREADPYRNVTVVWGPFYAGWPNDRNYVYWRVRIWQDPSKPETDGDGQVYASTHFFDEWAFLDSAYALGGRELDFVQIDRQVDNCTYGCMMVETFGINLTAAELRDAAREGLKFKAQGRKGSREFSIPAAYFQGVLAAADRQG